MADSEDRLLRLDTEEKNFSSVGNANDTQIAQRNLRYRIPLWAPCITQRSMNHLEVIRLLRTLQQSRSLSTLLGRLVDSRSWWTTSRSIACQAWTSLDPTIVVASVAVPAARPSIKVVSSCLVVPLIEV